MLEKKMEEILRDEAKKDEIWSKNTIINTSWGNYSIFDLRENFNKVAPKENWKNPIDAIIDAKEDIGLLFASIEFMTGSMGYVTIISRQDGHLAYHIKADGYYRTIGA